MDLFFGCFFTLAIFYAPIVVGETIRIVGEGVKKWRQSGN